MAAIDRETLLLYAWADLTYEGIALAMDVPVGTVRSRLNRARRALRASSTSKYLTKRRTTMDDLQLLREMRNDIGSAPPATLARGREKVMAKISPASTTVAATDRHAKSGSPIRLRRRVLIASAAAALLVGGIVVADVVRPNGPGATAEAAEVLNNAAAATIQTSDPVVGPGQYLKIETTELTGSGAQAADGSDVNWQETTGGEVYVPADCEGEWVWNREGRVPLESSSEEAKAEARRLRELSKTENFPKDQVNPMVGGVLRAKGGAFYGNEPTVIIGTPLKDADSLSRDPRALLDLIYERTRAPGSPLKTRHS